MGRGAVRLPGERGLRGRGLIRPGSPATLLQAGLLLAASAYLADLAFPWSRPCLAFRTIGFTLCQNIPGWRGLGALGGLLTILLIALSALAFSPRALRGLRLDVTRLAQRLLALTILGLTIAEMVMDRSVLAFGAWICLGLAVLLSALAFGLYGGAADSP